MNPNKLFPARPAGRIRRLAGPLGLAMGLVMVALLFLAALPAAQISAAGPDEAYVVVQFDENSAIVRPISFTAPISGLAALEMTGLDLITKMTDFGPAVCAIEGVGDSAANCFSTGFWASSFWNGSAWESYSVGAGSSVISDGAIELWAWSPGFVSPASPGSGPQFASAAEALNWLTGRQSAADGGYGNASGSVETLLSIGANDLEAGDWRRQVGSPSLAGYMLAKGAAYANSGPAEAGKMAVGLAAAGGCWPAGAMGPTDYYSPTAGAYSSNSGFLAWAVLGTRAFSQAVPAAAVDYLKNSQQSDGGWEWAPGWTSDTNTTALALQALVAAGEPVDSSAIISGLNFLEAAQNNDGGFPYDSDSPFGADSDANSTAYVVQALLAGGEDPLTDTWTISNSNPISYLLSMQLSDGSFEWQKGQGANQIATQQAIPALLNRSFPLNVMEVDQCKAYYMPVVFK